MDAFERDTLRVGNREVQVRFVKGKKQSAHATSRGLYHLASKQRVQQVFKVVFLIHRR